jgi:hypothetical protein
MDWVQKVVVVPCGRGTSQNRPSVGGLMSESERFMIRRYLQDPRERAVSTEDSGIPLFLYGASLSSTKELSTFQSSPPCSRGYQSVFPPPGARCPPEQPANRRIPNAAKRSNASCFIPVVRPESGMWECCENGGSDCWSTLLKNRRPRHPVVKFFEFLRQSPGD